MAQTAQVHVQAVENASEATISREFLIAKDTKVDIAFPVKFRVGHRLTANEAAQLTAHYLRQFTNNKNSAVERNGKTFTSDELIAEWRDYELGAPREGTGQTLHDQAIEAFAREYAKEHNMAWPVASAFLPQGVSIRKATDAQKEAAQAKADTQLAAVLAKFAASTNASVVAGIARHEAILREKREAAKASVAPTVALGVDALDI